MITGGQTDGAAFIGRDDIVPLVQMVRDIGADILQQTVRNPGEKVDVVSAQGVDEVFGTDHRVTPRESK